MNAPRELENLLPAPPLSQEAKEALGRAAREELAAHPKARPWWVDGLVVLALNLVMGVGAAAAMQWSSSQHASMTMRAVVAAAWLAVMAVGSVVWLRPGPAWSRWAIAGGFVLASVLAVGGASGFDPGAPFFSGMSCALTECLLALVPVSVVVALSMRFAAGPAHVFAGALAAASGATLALHFHCSNGTVSHLLVFHVLPAVVLGGLGVAVRSLFRPRSFVP